MMKRFCIALLFSLFLVSGAQAQDTELILLQEDTVIKTAWTAGVQVMCKSEMGPFDAALLTTNGEFRVIASDDNLYFALNEWSAGVWAQFYPVHTEKTVDDRYLCVFSLADAKQAYADAGGTNIRSVQALHIGTCDTSSPVTIHQLSWYGEKQMTEAERITVYSGLSAAQSNGSALNFTFTSHVGGTFDATRINKDSRFEVVYKGKKGGVDLVLISHSGASRWAKLTPNMIEELEDGSYKATYLYNSFIRVFGKVFDMLDEIRAVSNTDSKVVLKKIYYCPGEGDPVAKGDGRWNKPDTGIAFIGDSIVQNVYYNEGDFNKLLGRSDCVNFGIGAQTTTHCLNRIDEIADRSFRQLVIWCGINDIGTGAAPKEIAGRIFAMVQRVREKNEGISFVLISVLPTASNIYTSEQHKIRAINEALSAYADENADTVFVDCYSAFLGTDGYCRGELVLDGLHPNSLGYSIVKEKLLPVLVTE